MTPAAVQLTRQLARAESELADVERAAGMVHSLQLQLAAADSDIERTTNVRSKE